MMLLAHQTWPSVEEYLKTNKKILIGIGSTEQHGPTALIGTDFLTADAIAREVGKRTNTMVAPPVNYGMARHHMAFAGSASLMPQTLIAVVKDLVDSFQTHGFEEILFINGHGGNGPSVMTAFCEIKARDNNVKLELVNWWKMPEVLKYEEEHFGDQSGFHATIGEVSVTMLTDEEAFENIESRHFKIEKPEAKWPLSPQEFRKAYPDGRMSSNPGLATKEHGKAIFELTVNAICQQVTN